MSLSRKPSQPRSCCGARSTGPDQPPRANGPLTSAKPASCLKDNSTTPGPFDNVNSKSSAFEKRTITSPMSVVVAVRYMSCPFLVCQLAAASENWWCELVAQLVTQKKAIARKQVK